MNVFAWFRNARRITYLCIALVIPGLSGGSVLGQNPQPIFPPASPVALTDGGFPIFTGDFNGDKQPDLAYLIHQFVEQYSLVIVLSAGSNAAATKYTVGLCSSKTLLPGVTFADVNNDGKLDLVFACNGALEIQLGNGDGTFQLPAYFNLSATSIYQVTPVLADFNGDGYLDIGVLSTGSAAPFPLPLAVFLNQGAASPGVFNSPTMYAGPAFAGALAAGDFNGEGKQDLIVAALSLSFQPIGFSVLYGNGDGTLNPATVQSVSPFYGFTTGDFNGDGITDLAFLLAPNTNAIFTSVQILLGNTSGSFSQGAAVPVAATIPAPYLLPLSIAAVHLTNDGNLDLVVNTNLLTVLHGDGKGGFTPLGSYAVQGNPASFADLNGDGKQDLIVGSPVPGTFVFSGNGDGTFQAPPGTPVVGPVADINNDGIADMVFTPSQGNYFGTALGRGDGTFDILNQTTPLPAATTNYLLMTGDFNGDGKTDTIAVQPGSGGANATTCVTPDAQLLSFLGAGNGQFQAKGTALALGVSQAGQGITGDFNADGKLDILLPFNVGCQAGLLFLAGVGDGTFAAPVNLGVTQGSQSPSLIPGDLNGDKKLDFVWGDAVFLGNGDGTFKQVPLTLPADSAGIVGVVALADLNGDGILDAVSGSLSKANSGSMIYAGKGDGTFAATPFYTVTLPANTSQYSFAAQDVNGDGNPDLLVVEQGIAAASLGVYLGDGKGNFTKDTNNYFVSASASTAPTIITPARLNNQAPGLPNDNKPDLLIALSGSNPGVYVVSLLNQLNPVPGKLAPVHSTTQLQTSLATASPGAALTLTATVLGTDPTGSVSFAANGNSLGTQALVNGVATLPTSLANAGSYTVTATYAGDTNNAPSTSAAVSITIMPAATATTLQATPGAGNVNGQIVLTATVSGDSPTGSVSFAAGTTSLGTVTLTNGVATLQTSFSAAGSYSTTATYQGNQNNAVSTSNTLTIVIAAPDFKVTTTPASGTISAGQTATFMFTVTPVAGYSGTVKFSCGPLPAEAACSFSPSSVMLSSGTPASSTLTVTTAAATAALKPDQRSAPPVPPWIPAGALALAGCIVFAPRKIKRWNLLCWSFAVALSALGCGSSKSMPSTPATTPAGSYTVSVSATDSTGGPQHAVSISLLVQ